MNNDCIRIESWQLVTFPSTGAIINCWIATGLSIRCDSSCRTGAMRI